MYCVLSWNSLVIELIFSEAVLVIQSLQQKIVPIWLIKVGIGCDPWNSRTALSSSYSGIRIMDSSVHQ
jgi:hypothetical protein